MVAHFSILPTLCGRCVSVCLCRLFCSSAKMADPVDVPPLLPRLPSNVLRSVWQCLYDKYDQHDGNRNRHQHALRSCKALAASTVPFISSFCVHLESNGEPDGWELLLNNALTSLHAFPKSCQLSRLTLVFQIFAGEERAFAPLLPSLMMQPLPRLSGLLRLTIEGDRGNGGSRTRRSGLCLTFGDLASVALACPRLQHLTLIACLCAGPLFAALRPLTALRELRVTSLDIPPEERAWGRSPDALRSLSTLTQLTSLALFSASNSPEPGLCMDDVLPPLLHLRSLKSLTLVFSISQHDGMSAASSYLARLPHLEQLSLGPRRGPPRLALSASHLAFLPATSRLTSLDLHQAILDDSVLRLLAQTPSLTHLTADSLRPKSDCSQVPCTLTTLQLRGCPSPADLLKLPPQAIRALRFDFWNFSVSGDPYAAAALVRQAAELLALHWDSSPRATHVDPASIGIRRKGWAAAAPPADALLAALAPLASKQLHALTLDGWAVDCGTTQYLSASLPALPRLALVRCAVDVVALRALARLPALTELRLLSQVSATDVILLSAERCCQVQGPVLEVELGSCVELSQEQVEGLNTQLAEANWKGPDGRASKSSAQLRRWVPVGGVGGGGGGGGGGWGGCRR